MIVTAHISARHRTRLTVNFEAFFLSPGHLNTGEITGRLVTLDDMFVTCPGCQSDVFADPSGRCPQCDAALVLSDAEDAALQPEASPSTEPNRPLVRLPEPTFRWALLVLFVTMALENGASYFLREVLLAILPKTWEAYDIALTVGFLPVGLFSLGMAWLCLQPRPLQALGMRRMRPVHVWIALTSVIAFEFVWSAFDGFVMREPNPLPSMWEGFWQWLNYEQHSYSYRALARQPWVIVIFIGCVLPAICEEVFFRGYVGRGLVARMGPVQGVLLTSLLFGAVHLQPWHIVSAFLSGVLYHAVYLGSKSIFAPMLMHFTGNVIAFGLIKLYEDGDIPPSFVAALGEPTMAFVAAAYLAASMFLLWRTRSTWRLPNGDLPTRPYVAVERPRERDALLVSASGGIAWPVAAIVSACFLLALGQWTRTQINPLQAQWLLDAGGDALSAQQDDEALAIYTRAVELAPDNPIAWTGLSSANYGLRRYANALTASEEALRLAPHYASAQTLRCAALAELDRPSEALSEIRSLYQKQPDDLFVASVYCRAAWLSERFDEVLEVASAKHNANPEDIHFLVTMSQLYGSCPATEHRRPFAARQLATEACRVSNYQNAVALNRLASACAVNGDLDDAKKFYDQAAVLGDGLEERIARRLSREVEKYGPRIKHARAAWSGVTVDDLYVYPATKTLYIVVPQSDVETARDLVQVQNVMDDYQQRVTTSVQIERELLRIINTLQKHTSLSPDDAYMVALFVSLDVRALLTLDSVIIENECDLPLSKIKQMQRELLQALPPTTQRGPSQSQSTK